MTPEEQLEIFFSQTIFRSPEMLAGMRAELLAKLKENRPLRVYAGFDPTKPDLHLGHGVILRKLKQFQDLGHQVIVLIGTFTAQIGDNSDKLSERPKLSVEEIFSSAEKFEEQIFRILNKSKTKVVYNHRWYSGLGGMTLGSFISLAANFTVQQFLVRETIDKRLKNNNHISLQEFLYPLLQGYDAYLLQADVQIGASEQLFNLMAGRKIQAAFGQPEQVLLTMPILLGTDGEKRMSKTAGNYIGIAENPNDQYGKTMRISDETMRKWIPLVASWKEEEKQKKLEQSFSEPMQIKKELAFDIVSQSWGQEKAQEAAENFTQVCQKKATPEDLMEVKIEKRNVVDVLLEIGSCQSKGEARRLIAGKGVSFDGLLIESQNFNFKNGGILKIGKRKYFQITLV